MTQPDRACPWCGRVGGNLDAPHIMPGQGDLLAWCVDDADLDDFLAKHPGATVQDYPESNASNPCNG